MCLFVFSLFVFFVCDDARKNMCESNYPLICYLVEPWNVDKVSKRWDYGLRQNDATLLLLPVYGSILVDIVLDSVWLS